MYATQDLRDEHEGILVMLSVIEVLSTDLQNNKPVNLDHLDQILNFLTTFVDRCHHGKEEDLLFPALENAGVAKEGGPISEMLAEHAQGRVFIRAMIDVMPRLRTEDIVSRIAFAEAALGYVHLLRDHIAKENTVLFVMAEQLLPPEEHVKLAEGFERIERERIGEGVHEQFHALLHQLSATYL